MSASVASPPFQTRVPLPTWTRRIRYVLLVTRRGIANRGYEAFEEIRVVSIDTRSFRFPVGARQRRPEAADAHNRRTAQGSPRQELSAIKLTHHLLPLVVDRARTWANVEAGDNRQPS